MNKFFITAFFIGFSLLTGCSEQPRDPTPVSITGNYHGNYLGSEFKGNYVWGGAMNLAWNELRENIIHDQIKLASNDEVVVKMLEKLNNPVFTKADLDEASYYIKSGSGQRTVDLINQESRVKFPSKSFADLGIKLQSSDIISYAYFLKQVEYKTEFSKKNVSFSGKSVQGFSDESDEQRKNIQIISYESDERFILSLALKDENDRLILAKGYDMNDPESVVKAVNQNKRDYYPVMSDSDHFEAPMLHLDHHRKYEELIGKTFTNTGFTDYLISEMFENIKFDMDEKGARVENEAVITQEIASALAPPEPKNLLLNKPYWVIMQRKGSVNPYFILGVKNTEIMQ